MEEELVERQGLLQCQAHLNAAVHVLEQLGSVLGDKGNGGVGGGLGQGVYHHHLASKLWGVVRLTVSTQRQVVLIHLLREGGAHIGLIDVAGQQLVEPAGRSAQLSPTRQEGEPLRLLTEREALELLGGAEGGALELLDAHLTVLQASVGGCATTVIKYIVEVRLPRWGLNHTHTQAGLEQVTGRGAIAAGVDVEALEHVVELGGVSWRWVVVDAHSDGGAVGQVVQLGPLDIQVGELAGSGLVGGVEELVAEAGLELKLGWKSERGVSQPLALALCAHHSEPPPPALDLGGLLLPVKELLLDVGLIGQASPPAAPHHYHLEPSLEVSCQAAHKQLNALIHTLMGRLIPLCQLGLTQLGLGRLRHHQAALHGAGLEHLAIGVGVVDNEAQGRQVTAQLSQYIQGALGEEGIPCHHHIS